MITLASMITMVAPFGYLYLFIQFLRAHIPSTSLPRPFMRRQLFRGVFIVPVLDIFARVWLLLPFLPLVALSFVFNAALSIGAWYMSSALSQMASRLFGLISNYQEAGEHIQNSVFPLKGSPLWSTVVSNLTEIYLQADPGLRSAFSQAREAWETQYAEFYTEIATNFTSQPVVQEFGANVTMVITKALETLRLSDLLPHADLSRESQYKFLTLTSALSQMTNSLSQALFNDTQTEAFMTAAENAKEAAHDLQESLLLASSDILGNNTLSPGGNAALDGILRVMDGRSSISEAAKDSWQSAMDSPSTWKGSFGVDLVEPIWVVRIIAILVLLCGIVTPLLLMARAGLQLWLQWHVTKYYAKEVEQRERTVSGWVLTGGVVGAAFGTTQACYGSGALSLLNVTTQGRLGVLVHTCVLVMMHGVGMVAISSAQGRADVIENWEGGRKWWIAVIGVQAIMKIWWDLQLGMMVVADFLGVDVAVTMFMCMDFVVSLALRWCVQRVVAGAKKDEEEHLKRD